MQPDRTFRLRVTYEINERLAYLSHLEMTRALERIVRRSELPFAVTCGFSPHMKIAFGQALPVGVGGLNEIFDVSLISYVPEPAALSALVDASPLGIVPKTCKYIEDNAKAASVAYPVSFYEALFSAKLCDLKIPLTVDVVKKSKVKTINVEDHLIGKPILDENKATFALVSKDTGSLRPDVFLKACLENTPGVDDIEVIKLTRTSQESIDV